MAEIGYAITTKLIEVLALDTIQVICRLWKYESQLEKLKQTVSTIQHVFLDADAKWDQLSNQDRDFIMKLKDVVYDAEDVFDEFRTRAELNQLAKKSKVRKFFGKVRSIFSSDKNQNEVYHAYRVSHNVKDINERLVAIATEHKLFELKFDHKPIVRRPNDTCSYIDATKIIGRDKDKESIISMLLEPDVQKVIIVGIGGLGKTALTQFVFSDEKVMQKFSDRLWVCVSDQQGEQFDVKLILCKILELITGEKVDGTSLFENVKNKFLEKIKEKRYLLVLDDVWNEDREKWVKFEEFLRNGQEGSKIIVTTRSEQTARIIGDKHVYKLDGLSDENSQLLFEMSAFGDGEKNNRFVKIGEKIVGKCHRNPLAIKVIGSLLFGQDYYKWKSVENSGLAEISEGSDKIMPILKLSYNKLTASLKSCFSYCAIFPKDFDMDKERLIALWMSQGYIVSFDGGQSVEDAAEEYFSILMKRCFFQDVKKDKYGNVMSVKMHDLMHDVAQEVTKEEICVVKFLKSNLGERVRHVNVKGDRCAKPLLLGSNIRSYICGNKEECLVDKVEKFMTLRVLELSYLGINKRFPHLNLIDRLLLLRYLHLCDNNLAVLPDSITRLYNLETLILEFRELKELPIDFCELVNLRHLDLWRCNLEDMPVGMGKLTKLRVLPYFVTGELKALQYLTKIKGYMLVNVTRNCCNVGTRIIEEGEGSLKTMKHLINLTISFAWLGECDSAESLLKVLEPPLNLKGLELHYYKGTTIPWSAFSPKHNLVDITIECCPNLGRIPTLSRLPHLKSLKLFSLDNLEYMEDEMSSSSSNDNVIVSEFFPSLESLEIISLEKLKAWWKEALPGMKLRFPRLSYLEIKSCPNLTSLSPCLNPKHLLEHEFPCLCMLTSDNCPCLALNIICPSLKQLFLRDVDESWQITSVNSQDDVGKLDVMIDKMGYVNSLFTNHVTHLKLSGDEELHSVSEVADTFQRCASTLVSLSVEKCDNLSSLSGFKHLIALEELILFSNHKLSIREEDEEPWKSFSENLRKLELCALPEMKSLPKGMRHLTSLQSLELINCYSIEGGLPEWMSCLSSLQILSIHGCEGIKSLPEALKDLTSLNTLCIYACPDLQNRCRKPNGLDFPKIQHVPDIDILGDDDD